MFRLIVCIIVLGLGAVARASVEAPPRGFHLPSLYHVGFWVHDIAKARAFYHDYLGYAEPYELRRPNGDLQMVVMKVNDRQVIYLFTDATKILPNGDNLDHLGLETDNIEAARLHLLAHEVKVGTVNRGRIGDFLLGVKDPDGHAYELTQFAPEGQLLQHQGRSLPGSRISAHLRSATLTTGDLAQSVRFYCDILGFRKTTGRTASIVRLAVPDGSDFIELLPFGRDANAPAPRAVPEYCLEVDNVPRTFALLAKRAQALGLPPPAAISKPDGGSAETSVLDPDGTRIVFREPLN
jgi:catechol 2,3-dioxygenase-like lactoylglutathione lyase family enzyme